MAEVKLVYIGDKFYLESGTVMGPLYQKLGGKWWRSDWGKVNCFLRDGDKVTIRPAQKTELVFFEAMLAEVKKENAVIFGERRSPA